MVEKYLTEMNKHYFFPLYIEDGEVVFDYFLLLKLAGNPKYHPLISRMPMDDPWVTVHLRWFLRDYFFNPFTGEYEYLTYPEQEWDTLVKYGSWHRKQANSKELT